MPLFEVTAVAVVAASMGLWLAKSRRDASRGFEGASRELDDAFASLGARRVERAPEADASDASYVFPDHEGVEGARGEATITRVDGSEVELTLRVELPEGSGLPSAFSLRATASSATADLPDGATLVGGMSELLPALLPDAHEQLAPLREAPNACVDRLDVAERVVTLQVTAQRQRGRSLLPGRAPPEGQIGYEDTLQRMWSACLLVHHEGITLAALRDVVAGAKPGGRFRASALRVMLTRAPLEQPTLDAWAAVVEGRHHADLLVCHEVDPERLERDLSYDAVLTLMRSLSDRPKGEQEAFATLIIRRLGGDAFVVGGVPAGIQRVLFFRAFDDGLLDDEELESVFAIVVGVASIEDDLDEVCDRVTERAWARGARTICMAKDDLGARVSDDAFLEMLEAVARADVAAAREYEIETALLELITPRPRVSVADIVRAVDVLALVGGGRTIKALREHHTRLPIPQKDTDRVLQIAQDIEDRLGGILSRGGLSVSEGGGAVGGLSQAAGDAGGLELSDD